MDGLLITFGCSWTFGCGASYKEGMTLAEYEAVTNDVDSITPCCYRTFLSNYFNLENRNFAIPGSSNQTQFRLAQNFFVSDEFEEYRKKYDKIIVSWAITSTARNDLYSKIKDRYETVMYSVYDQEHEFRDLCRSLLSNHYNHDLEVKTLYHQMLFWNQYFKYLGIKNIWIDTLNHHKYPGHIENLLFENEFPRDLLSKLVMHKGEDNYHLSHWIQDSKRTERGVKYGVLNPYSLHPVMSGHKFIFNLLSPFIEELLS